MLGGKPEFMLTLTEAPHPGVTKARQAKQQTQKWKRFHARLLRHLKIRGFPYFWHREAQKNGTSHLHILFRGIEIDELWAKQNWRNISGSFVVDVTPVDNEAGLVAYVSKHTAKNPTQFGRCKNYFASRDWDLRPKHKKESLPNVGVPYRPVDELRAMIVLDYVKDGWIPDYSHAVAVVLRLPQLMIGGP